MSSDPVVNELPALLRAARTARKTFAATWSPFVKAMRGVMAEFHKARKEGVDRESAVKGIESVLRAVWEKPTTKFGPKCDTCSDTGWEDKICHHYARCGREYCAIKHAAWEHRYVVPCACAAGDRTRVQVQTSEDALAKASRAAKARKGSGFRQVGS